MRLQLIRTQSPRRSKTRPSGLSFGLGGLKEHSQKVEGDLARRKRTLVPQPGSICYHGRPWSRANFFVLVL